MAKFAMSALTIAGTQIYGSAESTLTSAAFVSVSAGTVIVDNLCAVSADFTDTFILNDARIRVTAVTPTAGTHAQGDIAFKSNPAAGGQVGFVCVVAGTPGTWKTFGLIES